MSDKYLCLNRNLVEIVDNLSRYDKVEVSCNLDDGGIKEIKGYFFKAKEKYLDIRSCKVNSFPLIKPFSIAIGWFWGSNINYSTINSIKVVK